MVHRRSLARPRRLPRPQLPRRPSGRDVGGPPCPNRRGSAHSRVETDPTTSSSPSTSRSLGTPRRRSITTFAVFQLEGTPPRVPDDAEHELLQYTVSAPSDFDWSVKREDFKSATSRCSDSAPGPDGISDSAWTRSAPSLPTTSSTASRVSCSAAAVDARSIARRPAVTRLLTLSKTDAKITAVGLNMVLSRLVAATVLPRQHGFIRGRKLRDIVIDTEARGATGYRGALVLMDMKAAFPSLAHKWIFGGTSAAWPSSSIPSAYWALVRQMPCHLQPRRARRLGLLYAPALIKVAC